MSDVVPPSALVIRLARQITAHLYAENAAKGTHLTERALAEKLRVSRTPVRAALRLLEEDGTVMRREGGGFEVRRRPKQPSAPAEDTEEAQFLRQAELHLAGALPPRISERAVAARLQVSRTTVLRILTRAAEEGWAERLPGRGWGLLPVLHTDEALAESYRLRMALEPAGLLDPAFRADEPALRALRAEILAVIQNRSATPATIFALGLRFHELLMRQSRNGLLIEALARVNRLRRLAGYSRNLDTARLKARCMEHVALLDLVLAGKRRQAARRLRRHIGDDLRAKLG